MTLHATFDDVQDLTRGHNVQSSNVVIGSVRHIELDGYRARVDLSIVENRAIPVGTEAVIRRTSLLGEYYVDLVFPAGFDPVAGPFLDDDGEIAATSTQLDVEQLAERAAAVVGSVAGDDLGAIVEAGAEALDGRGATINELVDQAADVTGALADQQADITTAVDNLAAVGAAVAPASDDIAALISDLADAAEVVAGSRDRTVAAVEALVSLARATNETVLVPHTDRIVQLLSDLEPVLGDLAGRSDVLAGLVTDLLRFTRALPTAIHNGQILLLTWAFPADALAAGPR
jgi:phospholipid/cholesterol/gamma-HCH transport system substrate-binding protein